MTTLDAMALGAAVVLLALVGWWAALLAWRPELAAEVPVRIRRWAWLAWAGMLVAGGLVWLLVRRWAHADPILPPPPSPPSREPAREAVREEAQRRRDEAKDARPGATLDEMRERAAAARERADTITEEQ